MLKSCEVKWERFEEQLCIVTAEVRDVESMSSLCHCDTFIHFLGQQVNAYSLQTSQIVIERKEQKSPVISLLRNKQSEHLLIFS